MIIFFIIHPKASSPNLELTPPPNPLNGSEIVILDTVPEVTAAKRIIVRSPVVFYTLTVYFPAVSSLVTSEHCHNALQASLTNYLWGYVKMNI